ncbi:RNA polymerase sigma factor [Patulibacter sp. SYSU D01012]|uniref:RNA polymerase sigma factor n=1 Tax=Patulibacter sp. SYSU D01012 TaxID=2817381 RepID=UPI001B302E0C
MFDVSELYTSNFERVYSFFAYRVSNVTDAEDLTALTFERVVRHAARYDASRASVTTWLFAIAERVLIDHYRWRGRRDEREFGDGDDAWVAVEDRPSLGLAPEVQRALEALSDRERLVVGLRFGGELSGKEIAAVVGVTEANVHQILSRALRRMRAEIGSATSARR